MDVRFGSEADLHRGARSRPFLAKSGLDDVNNMSSSRQSDVSLKTYISRSD